MANVEQAVFTNMCKVTDGHGNVLMQRRADTNWPGYVFPGGHVEKNESITDSVVREVREETGLTVLNPRLCGVKWFMTQEGARYVVFLFQATRFEGALCSSEEGEAAWIPEKEVPALPLAPNFEHMLKLFDEEGLSEMFYPPSDAARLPVYR